jgi:hypothetical protein
VFRDFDIFGTPLPPSETDAVLIVDADAVLSLAVTGQRFQAVARGNRKIGERLGTVESDKTPESDGSNTGKFPDPLALEEPLGLLALEAPDH